MLSQHGTFDQVEIQLKKWHRETSDVTKEGAWVTKKFLIENRHYSKLPWQHSPCM